MNDTCTTKKVCIISPSVYPLLIANSEITGAGGAEAQLSVIGKTLLDRGYEIHYLVDDYGQSDIEEVNGLTIHKVPLRYMGGSNLYVPYDWFRMLLVLKKVNADYHIIKLPRNLLLPIGAFCKLMRKRLIFIGQIDTDVNLDHLKKADGKLNYLFYYYGMKFVDYVVAQNMFQYEGFKRIFHKRSKVIKNILTFPDIIAVEKESYVLWVGNSHQKKQPEKYIQLAKALHHIKFKMIVAASKEGDNERLKNASEGVDNLEYLGFIPFSDIADYYNKASLFVSTSTREGFPNTFLQSWQCNTPVVSLHVDPDNVITKYKLGRVSETFESLCDDVDVLMKSSEARSVYADNAKRYIESYHSKDVVVDQYIELIDELDNC